MPSNHEIEALRSVNNSSSGLDSNGNTPRPPVRTRRTKQRNGFQVNLSGSGGPRFSKVDSRAIPDDSMPSSPGRTDEEKYRDLTGADLIIVIDMQQALLDQLNLENKEFGQRFRDSEGTLRDVVEENDRLRAALNLKIKHANFDFILEQTIADARVTDEQRASLLHKHDVAVQSDSSQEDQLSLQKNVTDLETEIIFLRSQLAERSQRLEETLRKSTKQANPGYQLDLEDLTDSLGTSVKKLREREEYLLNDVIALKEDNARLGAENSRLKDTADRLEIGLQELEKQHGKEREMLTERQKLALSEATEKLRSQLKEVEERFQEVTDKSQMLTVKVRSEQTRTKTALEENFLLERRMRDAEDVSSASMHKLAMELSECRQKLESAAERHASEKQRAESEMLHYANRHRLDEEQIVDLRRRLTTAQTEWTAVSHENTRLSVKVTALEEQISSIKTQRTVGSSNSAAMDQIRRLTEELQGVKNSRWQYAESAGQEMSDFVASQSNIIEKFKAECERLLRKWSAAEKSRKILLSRSHSLMAIRQNS